MNIRSIIAIAWLPLGVACAGVGPDVGAQSDPSFRAAIADGSTSPFFVRIVLVDPGDGSHRVVCTEAPLLLGAIHREFDLSYDKAGLARAVQIALAAQDHLFRFTQPSALSNFATGPRIAAQNEEACAAIAGGASVRRADITGQLVFVR